MSINLKIFSYTLISILFIFLMFGIFISLKASYGGVNLNLLQKNVLQSLKNEYFKNVNIDNIVLRNNNEKGFYLEIDDIKFLSNRSGLIKLKTINIDFDILDILTFSLYKNIEFNIKSVKFDTDDFIMKFENIDSIKDVSNKINISASSGILKIKTFSDNINLNNTILIFDTDTFKKLVVSDTSIESEINLGSQSFNASFLYNPVNQTLKIANFYGNNIFLNDKSYVKYSSDEGTINLNFELHTKISPILNGLKIDKNDQIYPIISGFYGWQFLEIDSAFNIGDNNIIDSIIDNLNIRMHGIYELDALLPEDKMFDNFGSLTNYEIDLERQKNRYVVDIKKIKNDRILLRKGSFIKLDSDFKKANINLVTSINKNAAIDFLKSSILSRENSTNRIISFLESNLNDTNDIVLNFNIDPLADNLDKSLSNLYVTSKGKVSANYVFDDNKNPNFISGSVSYFIKMNDLETNAPQISGQINLSDTSVFIRQLNFTKSDQTSLKIKFNGGTNLSNDSTFEFKSFDSEIDLNGKLRISKTNHIFLDELLLNNNDNMNLKLSGDLSERILNLKIKGNIIDLSKNKVETKKKDNKYYLSEENYKIETNKVIFSGNVVVNNFKATIDKKGSNLSVSSRATFNEQELNYSREKNNYHDINIINSTDITYFINNEHPAKKLLSDGEFKMTSIRNLDNQIAEVKIDLKDFVLINTPASLKLLSLPSISGLVSIAEGEEGIRFGYGELNYLETDEIFDEIEAFAVSDSLGLIMEGKIDRKIDTLDLKGEISPMHLVNAIVQKLPILGPIIVGNEGEGLFSIDFKMTGSTDDPEVESNPLTIIKPRIIERAIEALENNPTIQ